MLEGLLDQISRGMLSCRCSIRYNTLSCVSLLSNIPPPQTTSLFHQNNITVSVAPTVTLNVQQINATLQLLERKHTLASVSR